MKLKVFSSLAIVAALAMAACQSNSSGQSKAPTELDNQHRELDSANYTTIKWIDTLQNFGTVDKGEKVKITFKFENDGSKPLFITNVSPSCGCTVADYTKDAILPGKEGAVTGEFDSNHGSAGHIHKSIMVTSNSKNKPRSVLIFEGEVKDKS